MGVPNSVQIIQGQLVLSQQDHNSHSKISCPDDCTLGAFFEYFSNKCQTTGDCICDKLVRVRLAPTVVVQGSVCRSQTAPPLRVLGRPGPRVGCTTSRFLQALSPALQLQHACSATTPPALLCSEYCAVCAPSPFPSDERPRLLPTADVVAVAHAGS